MVKYFADLVEGLAVGDDEAGWFLERLQGGLQFGGLTDHGGGVVVQEVAQHLYLRQYHAPFGG